MTNDTQSTADRFSEELIEKVRDAIAEALGECAFDCTRVWSAWSFGTMSQDDFIPIAYDDERLHELTIAALTAAAEATQ